MPHRALLTAATDRGRSRDHNEDAYVVARLGDAAEPRGVASWSLDGEEILLAVSDGLGGAPAGEVASELSVRRLFDALEHDRGGDPGERLRRDVVRASEKVREAGARPGRHGMGATLTTALLRGTTAYLGQVGDSRAYLLRDGAITQITKDQSYVQEKVDEGELTPEEAERSPEKNLVSQVMGQSKPLDVALGRIELREGDVLLLCSDGLTNAIDEDTIRQLATGSFDRAAKALVDAANDAGGPDNVTVVLAKIEAA